MYGHHYTSGILGRALLTTYFFRRTKVPPKAHCGTKSPVLKWFPSYPCDKYYYESYKCEQSPRKLQNAVFPDTPILTPALFMIYINDLSNICTQMISLFFMNKHSFGVLRKQ